jgi:dolichol-phosphate mannosyltransferase
MSAAGRPLTARPTRTIVALVVPTWNEAAHAEAFVERVETALAPFPIDWHAEMIDDSEDDTPSILRGLARRGAPLEVTRREEANRTDGPGGAVRSGLARARGDVVCVIDAELQHPPEVLPELLAPIVLGRADICVGSRYRCKGSAAGLESRWRPRAARASGGVVRRLFPATRLTSDPGSGLFALRREVLDSFALRPSGSRVLLEILVRARWHTICDLPYRFAVTEDGDTRLGAGAAVALMWELISLWRLDSRLAAAGTNRMRILGAEGLGDRRRVAPVHVEFLLDSPVADEMLDGRRRMGELT